MEEVLHCESGEAQEQVAQRNCGYHKPRRAQDQVGYGFEQPGLVQGVPAHDRGAGTWWGFLSRFQLKAFYDCMILQNQLEI